MKTLCENCGSDFFGIRVYCPTCGKLIFAKTLVKKYKDKAYDKKILSCFNCVYCKKENGSGGEYFCIKKYDDRLSRLSYKTVEQDECCNQFVYYKDEEIK